MSDERGARHRGGKNSFHTRSCRFGGTKSREPPDRSSENRGAAGILGAGPGERGEGHPCSIVPGDVEKIKAVV